MRQAAGNHACPARSGQHGANAPDGPSQARVDFPHSTLGRASDRRDLTSADLAIVFCTHQCVHCQHLPAVPQHSLQHTARTWMLEEDVDARLF
jgi:hypothetical protein